MEVEPVSYDGEEGEGAPHVEKDRVGGGRCST